MKLEKLESFLHEVKEFYDINVIGKSVLGKNIYAVNKQFDKNFKWALLTGGIHAREHLSTDLICLFIELCKTKVLNYNISFVPLINPDGVMLCCQGCDGIDKEDRKRLEIINKGKDFSLYKANFRGVDLNNNWDANWNNKFSKVDVPSSQGYYGERAMSEPEVCAVADWAKSLDLFLTINYHLKGEEIYFDFFQDEKAFKRDFLIASIFADDNGYKIKSTQNISSGGFKDWCVKVLKIPSLTIELGDDKFSHPYPKEQLEDIYQKNQNVFENIEKALKIYESFKVLK